MQYGKAKLRHEMKFFISWEEYAAIKARLAPLLTLDKNTVNPEGYLIRSLYFDDMYDTAMFEKLIGVQRRDKYRIRIYDYSDKVIKLECKSKYDAYISKVASSITRKCVENILDGDYTDLIKSGDSFQARVYAQRNATLLRPAIIVDYLREAYIYKEGNVRITFDKHVSAGVGSHYIFSKDIPSYPVVPKEQLVLEIKYDDYLPQVIRNMVKPITGDISAISKYVMCRNKLADIRTISRRVVTSINGI